MANHNKITFAKEYCLCRRIPYNFHGETLILGDHFNGYRTIFSVYNFTYADLLATIDKLVNYDSTSTFFIGMAATH